MNISSTIKTFLALSIVAVLFFSANAFAIKTSEVQDNSGKIAYVDLNKAINEVSDGKAAREKLKEEFREKQAQLDKLQAELKRMKDGVDRDRLLLSQDALAQKENQYHRKYQEFETKLETFKREMSSKEENLTKNILSKLKDIVREIGSEDGYSLVLERSQEIVLYAPQASDLTSRVVALYNGKKTK